jgi:hypothetical protein
MKGKPTSRCVVGCTSSKSTKTTALIIVVVRGAEATEPRTAKRHLELCCNWTEAQREACDGGDAKTLAYLVDDKER